MRYAQQHTQKPMALFEGVSLDVSGSVFAKWATLLKRKQPSLRNSIRTFLTSVGGFSQPARKRIRSLQDLLQTIQRFNLQYLRGADLDHVKYVGEGVSYKVSCNKHKGSGELFAVKQVKLPSAATNLEAFERQVECVLRDVEVKCSLRLKLHRLAPHPTSPSSSLMCRVLWKVFSCNVEPIH